MQQEKSNVPATRMVEVTLAEAQLLSHIRMQNAKDIVKSLGHVNELALYFRSDDVLEADLVAAYTVRLLRQTFKKLAKEKLRMPSHLL